MDRPARVVCFSPYLRWAPHAQWETTILHGLRQRGAEVRQVLCDGLFEECDMHWQAIDPRTPSSCLRCQADVAAYALATGSPYTWLGRYLLPGERDASIAWAQRLPEQELAAARLDGWDVAQWVTGSVHSHFRSSRLDLADEATAATFRRYLASGAIACHAIERLLDDFEPDAVLQFNGRQSLTRVMVELARRRGIRVVCHERSPRAGRISFAIDDSTTSLARFRELWQHWAEVPLSADELADTVAHLWERETDRALSWLSYTPPPQPLADVRARLRLVPGRPVWGLFTSSDDEVVAERGWHGAFPDQREWLARSIAFASAHPQLDLVVRIHPNTGGARSHGANVRQLREFEQLLEDPPANVRVVWPDDEVSTYSLLELTTVGLVYHSTVAVELACKGRRVVVAAGNVADDPRVVDVVEDSDGYDALLERLATLPPDHREPRRQVYAHRLAACVFSRSGVEFPLVRPTGPGSAELAYGSIEQLTPGSDAGLDRCVGIVLGETPGLPVPDAAALARDGAPERRWFAGPRARRVAEHPTVGVMVTSYQYGRFLPRALESVLAQEYPQEAIEIVVVDDGSTDDTAEAIAPYLGRVRYLRERNLGVVAAANRALSELDSDVLAILCADDMWPTDKLARQLEILRRRPEVGLVYGDMSFVDEHDRITHPSYYERFAVQPHRGRVYGKLLARNFATGSSIVVRGSLRDAIYPLWADAPWEDWWIVARAARFAELDFCEEPVAFYREHGDNICLGADGDRRARQLQRELPLRRLLLSTLEPAEAAAEDVVEALTVFDWSLQTIADSLAQPRTSVLPVGEQDRARSVAALQQAGAALASGESARALTYLARALVLDPWNDEVRDRLNILVDSGALAGAADDASPAPVVAAGERHAEPIEVRGFVAVASLAAAIDDPPLLAAFASAFAEEDDATLVLLAAHEQPGITARLASAIASAGLDDETAPDMLALFLHGAGLAGLAERADAIFGAGELPAELAALPRFDGGSVAMLRALADERLAEAPR